MPNHCSEHLLFSWLVLGTVIWHLLGDWSQSKKKLSEIKPALRASNAGTFQNLQFNLTIVLLLSAILMKNCWIMSFITFLDPFLKLITDENYFKSLTLKNAWNELIIIWFKTAEICSKVIWNGVRSMVVVVCKI